MEVGHGGVLVVVTVDERIVERCGRSEHVIQRAIETASNYLDVAQMESREVPGSKHGKSVGTLEGLQLGTIAVQLHRGALVSSRNT